MNRAGNIIQVLRASLLAKERLDYVSYRANALHEINRLRRFMSAARVCAGVLLHGYVQRFCCTGMCRGSAARVCAGVLLHGLYKEGNTHGKL